MTVLFLQFACGHRRIHQLMFFTWSPRPYRHDLAHICMITMALLTDRRGVRFLFYIAAQVGSRCARYGFADQFQFQSYDHAVVLISVDLQCNGRLLLA